MKTSHLISTINHTSSLPFDSQKNMKIEQIVLKYFLFCMINGRKAIGKGPCQLSRDE